jgi:hypothetical protein
MFEKRTLGKNAVIRERREWRKWHNERLCIFDHLIPKIKSRIAMAKAGFSKKNTLYTSKLELNLRKK